MFQQNIIPTDSIPTVSEETNMLKNMSFDQLLDTLVHDIVHFAISLAVAILVFYLGKFIIGRLYRLTESILYRRKVEPSLTTFVLSLVRIVLYFILIVTVIGILGIETSSFLALFASAGVAIGMALSGTLQNFAGGVLILLLKPYRIGDYIEAQGYAGTVTKIEMFNTTICTPDNKSIIIPNGGLSTGSINNYSTQSYRRVDWTIGISYGDNFDSAQKVLMGMIESDSRVLKEEIPGTQVKGPTVRLLNLSPSSVDITVRAWVNKNDYWDVFFDFNERVYAELQEKAQVSFPFPQLDVHITPAEKNSEA